MQSHYGYFNRTKGKDGDQIDVFIGDHPESKTVFVVDQNNPQTGEFDESKVMLGYNSIEEAQQAYLENYDKGWKGLGVITPIDIDTFKTWLGDGHRQAKPFSEYVDIQKANVKEPIVTDQHDRQELMNSLREGEMILSSKHNAAGKRMAVDELNMVREAVESTRRKLGLNNNPVTWEPSDINYQHAYNAYSAISFDPEKRAAQTQHDYVDTLDKLYNKLSALAKSPEQISIMWQQLERYKEGYLSHENAVLSAKSRTASPMITGPANFPTARNQKALEVEHNRSVEFSDWDDKAEKTAIKAVKDAAPQEQKDYERWQSIKKTLDSKMASIIAIDNGEYPGARSLFVSSLSGFIKKMAANGQAEDVKKSLEYIKSVGDKHSKPIFSANNEIWKLAETVQPKEDLTNKETETVGRYKGVVIMNNHSQERVQLMFDEKPTPEIIATLKSRGFHWSPSQRAWQRKNTPDGIYTAQKLMGEFFEKDEANSGKNPSFQIKPKIFDTAKTISEKYEKGTQIIREVEKMFSVNPSIVVKTNEDLLNSVNAINYNEQITEAIKHYFIGGLSLYGKVFINTLPHKTGNEVIRT